MSKGLMEQMNEYTPEQWELVESLRAVRRGIESLNSISPAKLVHDLPELLRYRTALEAIIEEVKKQIGYVEF